MFSPAFNDQGVDDASIIQAQLPLGGLLVEEERRLLASAAAREAAVGGATRFFETPYDLKTGRPVEAARGLEDRLLAGSQTDRDKYYDRIRRGLDGIEEEV